MKSNSVMSCTVANNVLTWTFNDSKTLQFDPAKCPTLHIDAMLHGFRQKIADAAAMTRNTETGKPATVAEKREAMHSVIAQLVAGEWNAKREGGGTTSLLFDAVAAHYHGKKSPDAVKKYLAGLSKSERDALAETKSIRAQIDKIRAARVKASGIDGDALLSAIPD